MVWMSFPLYYGRPLEKSKCRTQPHGNGGIQGASVSFNFFHLIHIQIFSFSIAIQIVNMQSYIIVVRKNNDTPN